MMPCSFGRTFLLLAGTTSFFFLNIYLIFTYIQMQHRTAFNDKTVQREGEALQHIHMEQCMPKDSLALSALKRAKTDNCKAKIRDTACRLENGTFHPHFPESNCPNHDHLLVDFRVGCFVDSAEKRTLGGFAFELKADNSHQRCKDLCYKTGYLYYGLEYKHECFCGDALESATPADDAHCSLYSCPGNASQTCGGFKAIEVYRTGFKEKYAWPKAKYVHSNATVSPNRPVKIFFLLQLNGRNDRQVRRMLMNIYSPNHLYYIHVDKRQKYMMHEMRKVALALPNVYMAPFAHSTIWGGASLLTMVQKAMRDALSREELSDWDYFINLSESDFPVMPLAEFEDQLRSNLGKSFMASHGYNVGNFVRKQGFDFAFVECEEHMWRVGKRSAFPSNLRIDGGSDWLVLHRELVEFSVSDAELPSKLRQLFESIILPLESFYHTLAYNSDYCKRVFAGNLRMTNWLRKQGCRCEKLKKIVDWCGCSPLVIRSDAVHKISKTKAHERPFYFARKFESLIDIEPIAYAEMQSLGAESSRIAELRAHPSYSSAFVNVYCREIDGEDNRIDKLLQSLLSDEKLAQFQSKSLAVRSIDVFKANTKAPMQLVFDLRTPSDEVVQLLIDYQSHSELKENALVNGYKLNAADFGMAIDHKEEIFRDHLRYLDSKSPATMRLKWARVADQPTTVDAANFTSPQSTVIWRDVQGQTRATHTLKSYNSIWGTQFTELDLSSLNLSSESEAGVWTAVVLSEDATDALATVQFPVFPDAVTHLHNELVLKFYTISDLCSGSVACTSVHWSTLFPDPKSDISFLP